MVDYDPGSFDIVKEEYAEDRATQYDDLPRREMNIGPLTGATDISPTGERVRFRPTPSFRPPPGLTAEDRAAMLAEYYRVRLMEMTNDDSITLTPQMVEVINDPKLRMTTNGEITRLTGKDVIRGSKQFSRSALLPDLPGTRKKKRKVSNYQKEFGKQLKKLKIKHPRTKISKLMGKAHRATRKSLKR